MRDALALIGGMPVADVSADDVRRVAGAFAARGVRQSTIHRYMVEVRATLHLAEDMGWIVREPKVVVRAGANERIAPPTPDEIAAIHAVAPPHLRRVIILGSQLGMRVGRCEMLRLRWEDVDFSRRRTGTRKFPLERP